MKISKMLHVLSVLVGFTGVITFILILANSINNTSGNVFGVTKIDALLCVVVLLLLAIWLQVAVIHHIHLEKKGEIV